MGDIAPGHWSLAADFTSLRHIVILLEVPRKKGTLFIA
jgi:hypothetical protein